MILSPSYPRRNGWFNASLGVILRLGSRARHLSSKSMKPVITFTSSSCNLADTGGMRRVLRSRDGLEMWTCLTTSCETDQLSAFFLSPREKGK